MKLSGIAMTDEGPPDPLLSELSAAHGPLLNSDVLMRLLGFKTQDACTKALRTGTLELPAFRLPGRPGYFVLTKDFAAWIRSNSQRSVASDEPLTDSAAPPSQS